MILNPLTQSVLLLLFQEAESGGFFSNRPLWRVINLAVFVALLIYILRNKIRVGTVFDDRAGRIVKELEQAKREKQEADQRLAEVEARLNRLDQEVAEMKAQAEVEAEREAARIRQSAEIDAEKIKQAAKREIDGAMRSARAELRAFVAEQSVELAESIIRREIKPEDNARMLAKYVDELGEVSK